MSVTQLAETIAKTIRLKDGRTLGFVEYGDPTGTPALYFHGWPTSRLEAAPANELAQEMEIRLISLDRPGCGASSWQPGRKLDNWPADVAGFADAMKLQHFAVIGNSGGAPYAAACAAKLPERITQLVILCGLGPTDKGRGARMMASARWGLRFARLAPGLAAWVGAFALRSLTAPDVRLFPDSALADFPESDRTVLKRPEIRNALSEAVREGFRQGARGPVWDGCLYAQPWTFSTRDIQVPTQVWHGEKDTIVPVQMGRLYASSIPHCESFFYPDEGHFSLPFNRMKEIFERACR